MTPSTLSTNSADEIRQSKYVWLLIGIYALFIGVFLLLGAGRLLVALFPLSSLLLAIFLYQRAPLFYVGFVWWLWFVGPVIRRLIDYQSGYLTPGPWTLAPLLVTSVCFATIIRQLPQAYKQGGLPFILCFAGVVYAFLNHLIRDAIDQGTGVILMDWLSPIAFGFHLLMHWRDYPAYRRIFQRTFVWGVLVMGAYGVWQFLVAPEWERFWLNNASVSSFGTPEPLGIRVSSSMDSPQTFAATMLAGLILLLSSSGVLRFPATGLGYLAFLLSQARAAWLGWVVAMLTLIPLLKPKLQMQLVITILIMSILVVPLTNMEPFASVINARIESLSQDNDVSLDERSQGYSDLFDQAISEIPGRGLGFSTNALNTDIGGNDGAILPVLFAFGWVGAIPYLGGILLLLVQLFQGQDQRSDAFSSAARAITLGTFAQIGFNHILVYIVFWSFLGMGLAANKFHSFEKTMRHQHLLSQLLPERYPED